MADLYSDDTFVMKKKAIYKDILTCGLYSTDNVYKVYEWREEKEDRRERDGKTNGEGGGGKRNEEGWKR